MGHVRDLPKSKLGVDVDEGFAPNYEVIPLRRKVLSEIREAAKGVSEIYVATDPDREGEAIGWHLAVELGAGNKKKIRRLMFNEITKKAVQEALDPSPGDRLADGRCAAGAPRARPAGRLQDQPAALGQGAARAERRSRAVGGAQAGVRPRARDSGVRARGVLVPVRAAPGPGPAGVRRQAGQVKGRHRQGHQRRGGERPRGGARRPALRRLLGGRRRSARSTRRRRSSRASSSRRRGSPSRRR